MLMTICLLGFAFSSELNHSILPNNQIDLSVTLPNGQEVVEMFAKQNGVQNVSVNITSSESDNGDGTSTYNVVLTGYNNSDAVEYRSYNFRAGAVSNFIPGPDASAWKSFSYTGSSSIINLNHEILTGNQLKLSIVLPTGQTYVEMFAKKNGVLNVATNITSSAIDNGDGTSTYSLILNGYTSGDVIEYRSYSYVAGQSSIFTPGADASVWKTMNYGGFTTADANYILGAHDGVFTEVVYSNKREHTMPMFWTSMGQGGYHHDWLWYGHPEDLALPLVMTDARKVAIYVQRCTDGAWVNLDDATPYSTLSTFHEYIHAGDSEYRLIRNEGGAYPGYVIGGVLHEEYACGSRTINVRYYYGYENKQTDGTVSFAYVINHF